MINTIPNPKKTFQIEKPPTEVKNALQHIPLYSDKYKLFKANEMLNLYTFEASEFLSLGVYIDVNYFTVNDSRTEVSIEVKRKVGTFNQSHEVTLANEHIVKITELLAHSLATDPSVRLAEIEAYKNQLAEQQREKMQKQAEQIQKNPVLYFGKYIVGIIIFIVLIIYFLKIIKEGS